MAYARFGHDSDVYVYQDTRGGYTCERCPRIGEVTRCETAAEMLDHLLAHRANGQRVPDDALGELERDIEQDIVNEVEGAGLESGPPVTRSDDEGP